MWYAPTFLDGKQYPNAVHQWIFQRLLGNGFWITGCDVGESYGNPEGRVAYTKFYRVAVGRFKLSTKPCLFAQSRGAMMLFNWAADHPKNVGGIAAIYPVCDILSWPRGLPRVLQAFHLTEAEFRQRLVEFNPIERLQPLATEGVPVFFMHGDSDKVVPLGQNSEEFVSRYRALGGSAQLIVEKGRGHEEVDDFFKSEELVRFFLSCGVPEGL